MIPEFDVYSQRYKSFLSFRKSFSLSVLLDSSVQIWLTNNCCTQKSTHFCNHKLSNVKNVLNQRKSLKLNNEECDSGNIYFQGKGVELIMRQGKK